MSIASQSVAGSLLIDAACLPAVRQQVRADDFELAQDRGIFEAACRLADAGQPVDVSQCCRMLGGTGRICQRNTRQH